MRMLAKGQPFMEVAQEGVNREVPDGVPVFSEANLYPTLGKGDARFVLGVAEEYARLIEIVGSEKIAAILQREWTEQERLTLQGAISVLVKTVGRV